MQAEDEEWCDNIDWAAIPPDNFMSIFWPNYCNINAYNIMLAETSSLSISITTLIPSKTDLPRYWIVYFLHHLWYNS